MVEQLNQLPASLEPIGQFGSSNVPVFVKPVWYKFFLSISGVLAGLAGSVLGYSLSPAITAAGTTQATAATLENEWSVVTSTPAGSGVILNNFGAGTAQTVFNKGGNTLKVYPFIGGNFDGGATNAPYSLANNKSQTFGQISTVEFLSTQLG